MTEHMVYNSIHVSQSTFRGGLISPVHRWFRLTPSFGPELVDTMLEEMETASHHRVMDPFSGAGTTLLQSKFREIESIGFEINPFLYFVCSTSTRLNLNPDQLKASLAFVESTFADSIQKARHLEADELDIPLPKIHNVYRWWRKDVLKELLLLRDAIQTTQDHQPFKDFFLLSLAGVLVPDLTNVSLGRLQLHFVDKSKQDLNVWRSFAGHAKQMIDDLERIGDAVIHTPSIVFHTDSTTLEGIGPLPYPVDRVITSPPYPNRYSYVWNTRPFLYFFELFQERKEAADLDLKTIGGTWGTATSALAKGRIEPWHPIIDKWISPIADKIRGNDPLMANYVMKYFNLLARQIVSQDSLLSSSARCAYVVGCSRIKGVYIETDRLLAEIFEGLGLGYSVRKIERFRRRHSGSELHESIVYAYKA